MAVQIDDLGGKILRRKIENLGVKSSYAKATPSLSKLEMMLTHVMKFADGSELRNRYYFILRRGFTHVMN